MHALAFNVMGHAKKYEPIDYVDPLIASYCVPKRYIPSASFP